MIDKAVLLEYCGGDEGLADQFITLFKTEAKEALEQIPSFLAAMNFDELSNTAHKMKSHFSYLGATEMAGIASSAEQLARAQESESLPEKIALLQDKLRILLDEI